FSGLCLLSILPKHGRFAVDWPVRRRAPAPATHCHRSLVGYWRLLLRAEFVRRSYGASTLGTPGSDEARGGELEPYPSVACSPTAVCSLPVQAARMSASGKANRTRRRIDADATRVQTRVMRELHITSSKPMLPSSRFVPTRSSVTRSRDCDGPRHLLI